MTITTQELQREFKYNSVKLPDPNPSFSLNQVRDFFANVYPEITSADIEGPDVIGNKNVYSFRRAVGTKGQPEVFWLVPGLVEARTAAIQDGGMAKVVADLVDLDNIGWFFSDPTAKHRIRTAQRQIQQAPDTALSDELAVNLCILHKAHCRVRQVQDARA